MQTALTQTAKKDDLVLMDGVQAMTFASKLAGSKLTPQTRRVLTSYRVRLRQAERFILDDNAVKMICHLSHEQDRLPSWSFLARLPFPVMWIEFNLHTKVKEFEAMNTLRHKFDPTEVSPVIGYLFYKDGDSDTRWIAHEFKKMDNGEVIPGMIAFLFDPEGDGRTPVRGSATWKSPTLSRIPNFPRTPVSIQLGTADNSDNRHEFIAETTVDPEFPLCGLIGQRVATGMDIEDALDRMQTSLTAPDWFVSRAAAVIDPFWQTHFAHRPAKILNNLISLEVTEQSGILRWLVTMFASINGLPRQIKPLHTRPGTHSAAVIHRLPFLRHANLSIDIPRDNRVMWARKSLDRSVSNGRKVGWHPVIGHFRVIEYGKARGQRCRHDPVMVENGIGMCTKCELMIRWIELPDGRGDPTIGVVNHTYKIRGKRP